jgi:glycosyltransferase involved in cell wall biosynthesis
MARLVRHELDCGLVIDPASPTDIALKIDRLINNKDMFNKFRANAESAAKRYNWENEERVLLDIYDTLR